MSVSERRPLETPAIAAEPPRAATLTVCCMTAGPAARLAAILSLLRPVADEILVAVDDRADPALLSRLAGVADRLILYPYAEPVDRPLPWLHEEASGDWVLSVDDDEIPSARLLAALPLLLEAEELTHYWLPRRWLYPDAATYLDEAPWRPDYQLRLVRNDSRFLRFSNEFHRPIVCLGPGRFPDLPLWHVDPLVRSRAARLEKARRYERLRPGMRIAGRALNHAFYVPELRPGARTAALPERERSLVEGVLGAGDPPRGPAVNLGRATREQIDRLWPGRSLARGDYRAGLELLEPPPTLTAGEQRTLDVRVRNLGGEAWGWGREAEPEIRLAARWRTTGGEPIDGVELRTHFPAEVAAGGTDIVPVHVLAPSAPGRYRLELDLVHEHVRWFGCELAVEVEVGPRRRLAVMGDEGAVEGLAELLAVLPELEPLVLSGSDPPARHGYPRLPGLRPYLLGDTPGGAGIGLGTVLAGRTGTLVRAARRLRAGGSSAPLPRGGQAFLEELAGCEALVVFALDAPPHAPSTRERWRVVATVLAARSLGVPVALGADVFPPSPKRSERALETTARRSAAIVFTDLSELAAWLAPT